MPNLALSYDASNRLVQAGTDQYGYAPDGRRIWKNGTYYFHRPAERRIYDNRIK